MLSLDQFIVRRSLGIFGLITLLGFTASCPQAIGWADVLTKNYDNQRSGANLSEKILNQSNVNAASFGKLFTIAVDDQVYAGLLYASNLTIAGGVHNVLYVATVNNSVYAFDADAGGNPLWQWNFNGSGRATLASEVGKACDCCGGYKDFSGNIGIVGTPVIDPSANAMYFVTRTVENGGTVQRLHSIDITSGQERANSPQPITATVAGTGDGKATVVFAPLTQNQRPALSLSQGVVYIAWASFCDSKPYHGWVMGFDSTTLAPTGVFNTTPNGSAAGIWMGGGGPAFDSFGNMYVAAGNGTTDHVTGFGESVVRLSPRNLQLQDYFIPEDFAALNAADNEIGSSAPTFVPGTNMLVEGSKQGIIFLLNSLNLGNLGDDSQIPQSFQAVQSPRGDGFTRHIHAQDVMWASPQGMNLYVWGENDYLRAYRFNGSTFNYPAAAVGSVLPPQGMPGGMMTLSANGSNPGSGILWSNTALGDANKGTVPGKFYAFNAETLQLLWSSSADADNTLNFAKFNNPIVQNGKVYLPSFSNIVSVYGLKSNPTPAPVFNPAPGTYAFSEPVAITDGANGAAIYYTLDGTTPTASSSLYTSPISVTWDANIKAIAIASGAGPSTVTSGTYTIKRPLATPLFTPTAGTYPTTQTISIAGDPAVCGKSAACSLYYTADGSTPTASSPRYTAPLALPAGTTTFRSLTTAPHYADSPIAAATYTGQQATAATPVLNPPPGKYSFTQTITITDSTAGAVIYYTLDGTAPTTNSTQYKGSITITWDGNIRAMAKGPNTSASATAPGIYTIERPLPPPAFSLAPGAYTGSQTITVSEDPALCKACTFYYTINGPNPTVSSPVYSGPLSLSAPGSYTVTVFATGTHYAPSPFASATYTLKLPPTPAPAFNPAPGTYGFTQQVGISETNAGAAIYYTLDGSTPTPGSAKYTGPIQVTWEANISAIAVAPGASASPVISGFYSINRPLPPPAFSLPSGTYTGSRTVTISEDPSLSQCTFYFTINGPNPTVSSAVYSGPLSLSAPGTYTVTVFATGRHYAPSPFASATYVIK